MPEKFSFWKDALTYIYIVIATVLSVLLGVAINKYALPLLNTLFILPVFLVNIRRQRRLRNVGQMLLWAVTLSATVIVLTVLFPETMAGKVIHGEAYCDEMLGWVATGIGAESSPSLFIPLHLKHYSMFIALCIITGGTLALMMGSILVNYMSFYVGHLFLKADAPLTILIFGWPIWSILRVIGFVVAAIALSEIFWSKVFDFKIEWRRLMRWMACSLCLIIADIIIKAALAPTWQEILKAAVKIGG